VRGSEKTRASHLVDPLDEQQKDSLVRKVFDLVRKRTFRGALYIFLYTQSCILGAEFGVK